MRKIKFDCRLSVAENVAFTAVLRDLHRAYPNTFVTDVSSSCPAVWEHNPLITSLRETASDVEVVECKTSDIMEEAAQFYHILHRCVHFVNRRLGVQVKLTRFRGHIHISELEKSWYSQIAEIVGEEIPFWVITTSEKQKKDFVPDAKQLQRVIDRLCGKVQFVHVGTTENHHYKLNGVIDLHGQTDWRQIIRLVYHAQGVLSCNSLGMHLAAAVETKNNRIRERACVAIAPGRNCGDVYPFQQNVPLLIQRLVRTRSQNSRSNHFPVAIADEITRRLQLYVGDGLLPVLSSRQARIVLHKFSPSRAIGFKQDIELAIFRREAEAFVRNISPFPGKYRGRGIVICAGGTYLPGAWVCINMLRKLGCRLPIQIWHLGQGEINRSWEKLVEHLGVRCINSLEMRQRYPARQLNSETLKAYAVKHCSFREVLLLDADNVPTVNPKYLFGAPEFTGTGAVFWPGIRSSFSPRNWKTFGVPYTPGPELDSGQILLDKKSCWKALCLALWYNEHLDFCRGYVPEDKNILHLAFCKIGQKFSLVSIPPKCLDGTICQHDFQGRRIFQHRQGHKWQFSNNPEVIDFLYEKDCRRFLNQLRDRWRDPLPILIFQKGSYRSEREQKFVSNLTRYIYEYQRVGHDCRRMSFNHDGTIGFGAASLEKFWNLAAVNGKMWLEILSSDRVICRLTLAGAGQWRGRWNYYERMPIRLTPEKHSPKWTPIAIDPRKHIFFRAPLNGYTGYGLHANQIVSDLQQMGYRFSVRAFDINETFAPIPENVRKSIACQEHPGEWELVLRPPGFTPIPGKKTVYFTMWESTQLPPYTVPLFNQSECVIVPTQWNASSLRQGGVRCPIHVVPLGIKTDIFTFSTMDLNGPCIFGTAGRLESGGTRKGISLVIDLFKKAFPTQKDVELRVKIFPDCQVPREADPRIKFDREYFSERQMAAWYRELTCFVSGARGEGWGLMQHQSLATGRPLIGVCFGGVATFFSEEIGYPVDFKLVPAGDLYTGCGFWAEPNRKSIVEMMRRVYRDREEAQRLGVAAAASVARFSWLESSRKLRAVLQEVGMID